MNLLETLKQLKKIQPDPAFTENAKRAILAREPLSPMGHGWSAQRTIWKIIETGAAVALTGFFILLITGALSGSSIAPVQYSAIDPQSLRAEAQAIDMQIQLANLNYGELTAESTAKTAGAKQGTAVKAAAPAVSAAGTASTTATTTVSIDQALQSLAN